MIPKCKVLQRKQIICCNTEWFWWNVEESKRAYTLAQCSWKPLWKSKFKLRPTIWFHNDRNSQDKNWGKAFEKYYTKDLRAQSGKWKESEAGI